MMDEVSLNHFFLTVDQESYKAIESSTFLREEFAPFEQRTTVRKDMTYTGSYLYGDHTYFEFFEVGASLGRAVGVSAIAFASEVAGASRRLQERLESALGIPILRETITRRAGDRDIEWFIMTSIGERGAPAVLQTWVMEYCGTFLGAWYPELKPESRGITRSEILERYTARIGEDERRHQKLFRDVEEITIALPDAEHERFARVCAALGYRAEPTATPGKWLGFGCDLNLIPATDAAQGITAVRFSLRRPKTGEQVYRFGKSLLRFQEDATAVWTFHEQA